METGDSLGVDLNRDYCSLKAVLESEDYEVPTDMSELVSDHMSQDVTALDKLKLCLEKNLRLQEELTDLLSITKNALDDNKNKQERLDVLLKNNSHCRGPRSRISSYLKSWKPSKSKKPYFIDYRLEIPPPNNDAINNSRTVSLPDFHFISNDWLSGDVNKLRVGVKQKNIELLSDPIKKEMCRTDISVDELKALRLEIRELRNVDDSLLLQCSPDIDWYSLAYEQFGCERSSSDCRLHYTNLLQPGISRNTWKTEEEKRLMKLVKKHGMRNWAKVTAELGSRRSVFQCIAHYQKALNPDFLKSTWTKEELDSLQQAIQIYGTNWGLVATRVGNRTGVQCSNRYHALGTATISSRQNTGRWSEAERQRLNKAVEMYGYEGVVWSKVAAYVQTRTSTQCRERWKSVALGSMLLRPWTEYETRRIIEHAKKCLENGEQMRWTEVAQELNRRDDDCRREWIKKASQEDLMLYKTLRVKSQKCVKAKRSTTRKDTAMSGRTLQPKDIEDDMLPEDARQQLTEYHQQLNREKGKPGRKASTKPNKKKRKTSSTSSTDSLNLLIPILPPMTATTPQSLATTEMAFISVSLPMTNSVTPINTNSSNNSAPGSSGLVAAVGGSIPYPPPQTPTSFFPSLPRLSLPFSSTPPPCPTSAPPIIIPLCPHFLSQPLPHSVPLTSPLATPPIVSNVPLPSRSTSAPQTTTSTNNNHNISVS